MFLSAACATQHEASESKMVASTEQIESLVVFAISPEAAERSQVEDTFSLAMSGHGVPTQATYRNLPTLETLEEDDTIIAMYEQTGANMGITIEVLKAQSTRAQGAQVAFFGTWVAGLLLDSRELRSIGAWGGLAAHGQAGKYELRVSLWDAADGELQWTMDTQSFTNEDLRQDAQKLADLVYAELEAKGFIK